MKSALASASDANKASRDAKASTDTIYQRTQKMPANAKRRKMYTDVAALNQHAADLHLHARDEHRKAGLLTEARQHEGKASGHASTAMTFRSHARG